VCKLEQDVEQLKAVLLAEFDLKWRPDGGVAAGASSAAPCLSGGGREGKWRAGERM
jgi:hypothetical protein